MGSDEADGRREYRRRTHGEDQDDSRSRRKLVHIDNSEGLYHSRDRHNRHDRHDRQRSRRSNSPDSRYQRSRSRDKERRDRHRNRRGRDERDINPNQEGDRSRQEKDGQHHGASDRGKDRGEPYRTEGKETSIPGQEQSIKRRGPLPSQDDSFAISKGEEPEKPVEKPNFGNTGLLAAASNTVTQANGSTVTLKYHEPPEARKPSPRDVWKLFVFKGADIIDTIELSTRSCWLIGRDTGVVDLPAEHPSISKQHAVIQFRYTEKRNEYGDKIGRVKPYLIDLESGNGTRLNNDKVPESRYLELRDKDMIQFGSSTREYVLMLAPKD